MSDYPKAGIEDGYLCRAIGKPFGIVRIVYTDYSHAFETDARWEAVVPRARLEPITTEDPPERIELDEATGHS